MKLVKISILLLYLMSFSSMALELKLDKSVYFFDSSSSKNSIKVNNPGTEITLGTVYLYDGKITGKGGVEFEYGYESNKIDIFPKEFIISPGMESWVDLYHLVQEELKECYFRIRIVPESASEALRNNPELAHLFSFKQLNNIEKLGDVSGKVSLGIGMGSIVILQNFEKLDPSKIHVEHLKNERILVIKNIGELTYKMENVLLSDKNGRTSYLPDMIVKPGDRKELNLSILDLKVDEHDLNQFVFTIQNNKEKKINF
ncbi:hypothetical protein ACWOKP_004408 [Vibrio parahaemolyticus]